MSNKQEARRRDAPPSDAIKASIGAIVTAVPEGKTPFAVAFPLPESVTADLTAKTSITFSLSYWKGDTPLEFGQVVALEKIQRFTHGWRAKLARPVEPTNSSKQ
ncbi:MAG: hypothetical protein Athens041674_468 [Parcubacteria group bacterium Athens0416_74]|nr:MAG: hypothetical protein Athens041674_468 [Parcubacteria group bacterium Athens0416_74]